MSPVGLAVGDRCDGVTLREGVADATTLLERRVGLIDALNVFPVPDGDTGSNLALTLRAATDAAHAQTSPSAGEMAAAIARGALIGAHGNSGVILSRYLQGIAQSLQGREVLDATGFAAALTAGADAARAAVERPVEGTMLSVASDAAGAASVAARSGAPLAEVIGAAAGEASASVERTRGALPALRQADVVDAGALGLATILDGLARSLRGEPIPEEIPTPPPRPAALALDAGPDGYCTEFVVRGSGLVPDQVRRRLRGLGDSLLAVGDSSTVRVHLHTLTPGDAVERGASFGAVGDLKVEDMRDQNRRLRAGPVAERTRCGMLAVADGEGFAELLRSLGATAVPDWRQLPVVVCLIDGLVRTMPADHVLVLVADPERSAEIQEALLTRGPRAASATVRATGNSARSVAAALACRPERPIEENLRAIDRALAELRSARLVAADPSGVVAWLDDGERLASDDLVGASLAALGRLGAVEREIITLYHGRAVGAGERDRLVERVKREFPGQRVESVIGGQARDLICLSCE